MSWNYTDASGREIIRDGEATKTDREIAYEQNVTGLEIAWRERIESFATEAVQDAAKNGQSSDEIIDTAIEAVATRLLASERWENVEAKDISDIAYEAVNRAYDAGAAS